MENASKALIIAGAILISIVLIGVGVLIVNNANGIIGTGNDQMRQQEISAFNSPYERYEGVQNGNNIKTLITAVNTNNMQYGVDNPERIITINDSLTSSTDLSQYRATINTSKTYTVTLTYSDTTSLITGITITEGRVTNER